MYMHFLYRGGRIFIWLIERLRDAIEHDNCRQRVNVR